MSQSDFKDIEFSEESQYLKSYSQYNLQRTTVRQQTADEINPDAVDLQATDFGNLDELITNYFNPLPNDKMLQRKNELLSSKGFSTASH